MRTRQLFPATTLSLVLITGCADMGNMTKQQMGTGLGGVAGMIAGNQIGSGTGRKAAIVGMGVAGAFIGNRIGKYLDDQDKQRLANATMTTAETGQAQTVVSPDTGTKIHTSVVTPAASAKPKPTASKVKTVPKPKSQSETTASVSKAKEKSHASPPSTSATSETVASTGQPCQTVRQTVVLQNGSSESEDVRMCQGPNGWQPA